MNQETAETFVLALRAAFPRPEWEEPTIKLYVIEFAKCLDEEAMHEAINGVVTTCRFRPSIAEVLDGYRQHAKRRREALANTRGLPDVTEVDRGTNLARIREMGELIGLSSNGNPRPVELRIRRRTAGLPLAVPPTDEEKADAIRVLKKGPVDPDHPEEDILYCEAERIMADADG